MTPPPRPPRRMTKAAPLPPPPHKSTHPRRRRRSSGSSRTHRSSKVSKTRPSNRTHLSSLSPPLLHPPACPPPIKTTSPEASSSPEGPTTPRLQRHHRAEQRTGHSRSLTTRKDSTRHGTMNRRCGKRHCRSGTNSKSLSGSSASGRSSDDGSNGRIGTVSSKRPVRRRPTSRNTRDGRSPSSCTAPTTTGPRPSTRRCGDGRPSMCHKSAAESKS
ncbi:uncharacterized protein B0I36DRAFT_319315 [Microdochium trichocladiopsis]|uniref:Uncharacterized protein n=1 Tax=Microdochium trichocladiopsis TaxID=1682393 RepID=A0A9P9BRH1_9PEZI|nr:uncharacterized protein B0I36DRAFT_319315 [Microdochium trichocladiopsis]KAH7035893.1 hypothetical protein B0I36DRAFT_319315 [Microdochium trichocladiopsis]